MLPTASLPLVARAAHAGDSRVVSEWAQSQSCSSGSGVTHGHHRGAWRSGTASLRPRGADGKEGCGALTLGWESGGRGCGGAAGSQRTFWLLALNPMSAQCQARGAHRPLPMSQPSGAPEESERVPSSQQLSGKMFAFSGLGSWELPPAPRLPR